MPIAVVLASLIVQTHFTYAYPAGSCSLAGLVGFVARQPGRSPGAWKRTAVWSLVLGVAVLDPAADRPVRRDRQSRRRCSGRHATARAPASRSGVQVARRCRPGAAVLAPGIDAHVPAPRRRHQPARCGHRRRGVADHRRRRRRARRASVRSPAVTATGVAGLVALVAGLVAAARIPVSSFGLVPQNYYWAWSLAAFVSIAASPPASLAADGRRPASRRVAVAAPSAARRRRRGSSLWCRRLAALPGRLGGRRRGRGTTRRPAAARPAGRGDRRRRRRRPRRSRPVAGLLRQRLPVRHARRVAARRDRVPLRARTAATSTASASRDAPRRAAIQRLLLISGAGSRRWRPARVIVAEVVGITDAELAEYAALQQRFGDLLRDGTIDVDGLAHADVAAGPLDELRGRADDPGAARRLGWPAISTAGGDAGIVSIPAADGERLRRAGSSSSNDRRPTTRRSSLEQPSAPDDRALLIASAAVRWRASRRFPRPG